MNCRKFNLVEKFTKQLFEAFTLAEVLITLGVIGIVAAMTLPALLNKAEKMILKNQFKKTYTSLSQALLKTEADLGYSPMCKYSANETKAGMWYSSGGAIQTECPTLRTALLKNLNVIQICENNIYSTKCTPEYLGFEKVLMQNNPDLNEDEALNAIEGYTCWNTNNLSKNSPAYILADGSIIISPIGNFPILFAVDINGKKGPNKWGHDVFTFILVGKEKSNLIITGVNYTVEKGGTQTTTMLKQMHGK